MGGTQENWEQAIALVQAGDDGDQPRVVAEKAVKSGQILGRFGRQNQRGLLMDLMWGEEPRGIPRF